MNNLFDNIHLMYKPHGLIISGYCCSRCTIGCLLLKGYKFYEWSKRDFMKKILVSCAITLNVCELSQAMHLATCKDGMGDD